MEKKRLIIIGSRIDGHAGVILAAALKSKQYRIAGFVDDDPGQLGKKKKNIPVVCDTKSITRHFKTPGLYAFMAIGDNGARQRIAGTLLKAGIKTVNLIDRSAEVFPSAQLGTGTYIGPRVVIHNDVTIGNFAVVNTGATVDHNNILEDFTTVSPGCHLGGRVTLKEGAFLGMGAIILPGVTVGRNAYVGAGAVVLKNVPASTVVAGVPAKKLQVHR